MVPSDLQKGEAMSTTAILFTKCGRCDHFIEDNTITVNGHDVVGYVHLDDGDKEHTHDAGPGLTHTLPEWKMLRPDLFEEHEDGKIGPSSASGSNGSLSRDYSRMPQS